MKTAMKEFIELLETQKRLFIEAERHTLADGIGRTILLSKQFIEKEKKQMCQFAFDYHDEFLNNGNVPSIEEYFNETYNQK